MVRQTLPWIGMIGLAVLWNSYSFCGLKPHSYGATRLSALPPGKAKLPGFKGSSFVVLKLCICNSCNYIAIRKIFRIDPQLLPGFQFWATPWRFWTQRRWWPTSCMAHGWAKPKLKPTGKASRLGRWISPGSLLRPSSVQMIEKRFVHPPTQHDLDRPYHLADVPTATWRCPKNAQGQRVVSGGDRLGRPLSSSRKLWWSLAAANWVWQGNTTTDLHVKTKTTTTCYFVDVDIPPVTGF